MSQCYLSFPQLLLLLLYETLCLPQTEAHSSCSRLQHCCRLPVQGRQYLSIYYECCVLHCKMKLLGTNKEVFYFMSYSHVLTVVQPARTHRVWVLCTSVVF